MDKEDVTTNTKLSPTPSTPSRNTTDDESITTSTESELFDTWTLVTDKNKEKEIQKQKLKINESAIALKDDDDNNRIELLKSQQIDEANNDDEAENELEESPNISKTENEQDSSIDDLSDGISIISESESAGRISPHPFLRDHLSNLNLKFVIGDEFDAVPSTTLTMQEEQIISKPYGADYEDPNSTDELTPPAINLHQQQLRQRRQRRSSSRGSEKALTKTEETPRLTALVGTSAQIYPLVKRSLAGIFYIGVAVAILALMGKLRNPVWQTGNANQPISELEQKMENMELQNNLMRAEIDLLSRQVYHLNAINNINTHPYDRPSVPNGIRPEQYYKKQRETNANKEEPQRREQQQQRREKTFKAWPGNGNGKIDAQHITKEDLKKPYKCVDGKFVEFARMCIENAAASKEAVAEEQQPVIDQIGNVVDYILQQSETFKSFENVVEDLHGIAENPYESGNSADAIKDPVNEMPATASTQESQLKQDKQAGAAKFERKTEKYQKDFKTNNIKNTANSKEQMQYYQNNDKYIRKLREKQYKKLKKYQDKLNKADDDDDDDDDDDSKEKRQGYSDDDDDDDDDDDHSKERNVKHKYSRERFINFNKPQLYDDELERKYGIPTEHHLNKQYNQNGDWHAKLMQNREQFRRQLQDQQRLNKNWYIERGDSRERMRS